MRCGGRFRVEADCQRGGVTKRRGPLRRTVVRGGGRWMTPDGSALSLKRVGKHPRGGLSTQPPARNGGRAHNLKLDRPLQP